MTLAHRKLSVIHGKPKLIKGPGLHPMKQVDLLTKWRPIIPFEFKDVICPVPSDEIKDLAKKARSRGRQKNNYINDGNYSTARR